MTTKSISTAELTRLLDALVEDGKYIYVVIYSGDVVVGHVNGVATKYRKTYNVTNGEEAQVFFEVHQIYMHREWKNPNGDTEYQFLIDVRIDR